MLQGPNGIPRQEADTARGVLFPLYDELTKPFSDSLPSVDTFYTSHLRIHLDPANPDALINTDPDYQTSLSMDFAAHCGRIAAIGTNHVLDGPRGIQILKTFQTLHGHVVWDETLKPLPGSPPALDTIRVALPEKIKRVTAMGVARNFKLAAGMPPFLMEKFPDLSQEKMHDIILSSNQPSLILLSLADLVEDWATEQIWGRKFPLNSSFIPDIVAGKLSVRDGFYDLRTVAGKREVVLNTGLLRYPDILPYKARRCPMARLDVRTSYGQQQADRTVKAYNFLWKIGTKVFMRVAPELFSKMP